MGKTAVICGYYGRGNLGDEAILSVLLQMLPQDWQRVVISGDPRATKNLHGDGIQVCNSYDFWGIFSAMRRADYFIWGGGSLMQDATSRRSPFYYGSLMRLAQGLGLKTIAWAQGIGPLQYESSAWWAKNCLQNCSAVSVRDRKSAELLKEWGISALFAPDPVWILPAELPRGVGDLPKPRIAVCLKSHPLLDLPKLSQIAEALVLLQMATDAFILLIPFQIQQDQAVAEYLARKIPFCCVWQDNRPQSVKGLLSTVEMAIAMRLHGVIMALGAGVPCFAISYDPKVRAVMDELGLVGYDLEQMPDDHHQLHEDWLQFYVDGKPLSPEAIATLCRDVLQHQELFQRC
ncbi:MAG: polysaccharide pyruvyl transferase CsaB [Pseudanabaenaceae cyanobacterium]